MCFLREIPKQPIINDLCKTNSQLRDKYNIKPFEQTTVLT